MEVKFYLTLTVPSSLPFLSLLSFILFLRFFLLLAEEHCHPCSYSDASGSGSLERNSFSFSHSSLCRMMV